MNLFESNLDYLRKTRTDWPEEIGANSNLADLCSALANIGIPLHHFLLYNLSHLSLPWASIRMILLDVDGVMTDGGMCYSEDGSEYKRFNTKDGMAIKVALKEGVKVGFISSGMHDGVVKTRAELLGVNHVYVGSRPKIMVAQEWMEELGIELKQCVMVGDDINDIELMQRCAISACPADAAPVVKQLASIVLESYGGQGCVREVFTYLPALKDLL